MTLEGRVKRLEENAAYVQRRLDKTESDKAVIEYRLEAFEKHQDHRRTADSSTSPETAITSARSTPHVTASNQGPKPVYAFNTVDLDPVKLHPALPSVLFVIDPELFSEQREVGIRRFIHLFSEGSIRAMAEVTCTSPKSVQPSL